MHGGDCIAEVLVAQGVPFLFTLCGGHISPILVGCKQRGIRVIDTRHEATAVFAADADIGLVGRLRGVRSAGCRLRVADDHEPRGPKPGANGERRIDRNIAPAI